MKSIFYSLMFLVFCLIPTLGKSQTKTVYVVHSYHDTFEWTNLLQKGIQENLNPQTNYIVKFLDSKKNPDPKKLLILSKKIIKDIYKTNPDLIILSDDNALKYIGAPLKENKFPIIFCGINGDPVSEKYVSSLENSGNSLTGILERYPLMQMIQLSKKLKPNANKLHFFFGGSITGQYMMNTYKKELSKPETKTQLQKLSFNNYTFFKNTKWEEWKKELKAIDHSSSIVVMQAFFSLKDKNNKNIPYESVIEWLETNTNLTIVGITNYKLLKGFVASISFTGYDQGKSAALIGQRILDGTQPNKIPITTPKNYGLYINHKRAKSIGLKTPLDLTVYSQNNWFNYNNKKDN